MTEFKVERSEIMNALINGFSNATVNGPLCEEPMQGACFILQSIEFVEEEKQDEEKKVDDTDEPESAMSAAQKAPTITSSFTG